MQRQSYEDTGMRKEPKRRPQSKYVSDTLVSVRTPGNVRQCVSAVWATQHSPDKLTIITFQHLFSIQMHHLEWKCTIMSSSVQPSLLFVVMRTTSAEWHRH